ncbi:MAG: cytochrome c [Gemmatimonadetes bacterium]|nr:cytochrome c [Gemmatimonadota bacterium]
MSEWGRGLAAVAVVASLHARMLRAQEGQTDRGQETFQGVCAACHTIGGGRLVGPDLRGVTERRSEQWIIDFVQHSQRLVSAGDSTAVALFKEYQEIPMPDQPLSADEVRQLLGYIRGASASGAGLGPVVAEATEEQILLGREFFQGTERFANGGPSCTSCHDVTDEAITGGGVLARELTTAFSRLGGPGVQSVIANPPFPVMQRAYRDNPLTEPEVAALVGFLGLVGAQQALHQPRGSGPKLFAAGLGGAVLLLALYSLAWGGRSRGSVNQRIYDRQIKST